MHGRRVKRERAREVTRAGFERGTLGVKFHCLTIQRHLVFTHVMWLQSVLGMIISGGLILLPFSELWTHNFSICHFPTLRRPLVAVEKIEANKDDDGHGHHEDDERYVATVEVRGGVG